MTLFSVTTGVMIQRCFCVDCSPVWRRPLTTLKHTDLVGTRVWIKQRCVMGFVLLECSSAMGSVIMKRSFPVEVFATQTQHITWKTTENVVRNALISPSNAKENVRKTTSPVAKISAKAILHTTLRDIEHVGIVVF